MLDLLYQKWYFPRPELAQRIVTLLMDGPGDPVALVGERRIGKTSLLLFELMPLGEKQGLLPVYVDVYQHRADPLAAINYALQEAIDDLTVPNSTLGRRLKTSVKKIGLASAALELGDEPARRRPDDPFLLVDWLIKTLVRTAKKPPLLIFDEVQELATVANGENIVSAIRSAITKSKNNLRVIFTGSSQEKLLTLFSRSRAALYEGASTLAFPYLGDNFLAYIAQKAKERFKKRIALNDLAEAYARLHHQPRALIDLVLLFSSSNVESLISLLNERVESQLMGAQYDTLWRSLKPLHQRICMRIAKGGDVTSLDARGEYALGSDRSEIPASTVSDALRALVDDHVLTKTSDGRSRYRLDDPLFAEWLRREDIKLLGQRKR
jgi:uncharacterized protein